MARTKGIDVSHWQGTIDWNKVKAAGIQFAIIKAGGSDAGTYTDSKWEANYKG
ncbi:MAG TPA: GH25 family lysozyme, partial [Spirochaetia bacterium]|nr:GH25 family lysozyme [Spirochaetia bacterium]